jgi:hypothetical protein
VHGKKYTAGALAWERAGRVGARTAGHAPSPSVVLRIA